MTTFEDKAKSIIKNSIKNAIFIDEKARDFYEDGDKNTLEVELSKDLFDNFKENGVSLTVNKFNISEKDNQEYRDYLIKSRDLILLDWHLENDGGEEHSLDLLKYIIKNKSIHFCSIYTSHNNFTEILNTIQSYFIGLTKDKIAEIKDFLEEEEGFYKKFKEVNLTVDKEIISRLMKNFGDEIKTLTEITGKRLPKSLKIAQILGQNLHVSDEVLPTPSHIDTINHTLTIENTIISIITKENKSFETITDKLCEQITSNKNSFLSILGIDMQNTFQENSSFIEPNILDIDFDTFLHHWKYHDSNNNIEEFNDFIASILFEQGKSSLNASKLSLLDSDFLRNKETSSKIDNTKLCNLNSFYNGAKLKNKSKLNFGDIFFEENNNKYYLCITALCDCANPSNIKNKFYFIEASKDKKIDKMLSSGDRGFKSYLNDNTVIPWVKISEQKDDIKYIKPFQLHIDCTDINADGYIQAKTIKDSCLITLDLEYKFSLKNSYAQRIANHAFAHPVRVGVDFVKP